MQEIYKYIGALILGSAFPLAGQYIIESFKQKSDRRKYSLEKIIQVGEEFYNNSGLALMTLIANLEAIKSYDDYSNPEAIKIFNAAADNMEALSKSIASTKVTTTIADIFYNVTDVTKAIDLSMQINIAVARFIEMQQSEDISHESWNEASKKFKIRS